MKHRLTHNTKFLKSAWESLLTHSPKSLEKPTKLLAQKHSWIYLLPQINESNRLVILRQKKPKLLKIQRKSRKQFSYWLHTLNAATRLRPQAVTHQNTLEGIVMPQKNMLFLRVTKHLSCHYQQEAMVDFLPKRKWHLNIRKFWRCYR